LQTDEPFRFFNRIEDRLEGFFSFPEELNMGGRGEFTLKNPLNRFNGEPFFHRDSRATLGRSRRNLS
jgi:hypothetical protein